MRSNLILCDPNFNNFYILYKWFEKLILPSDIIITNHRIISCYVKIVLRKSVIFEDQEYSKYSVDRILLIHDGSENGIWKTFNKLVKKIDEHVVLSFDKEDIILPHQGKVVHIRKNPNCDVYIGRYQKGLCESIFANPFPLINEQCREEVIWKYSYHLIQNPNIFNLIKDLKNKTLGCWCSPKLCHGDVLVWICEHIFKDK